MSAQRLCSGLGSFAPCEKRDQCANYVHWIDDPRSEFNACAAAGQPLKYYIARDISIATAAAEVAPGQGLLF